MRAPVLLIVLAITALGACAKSAPNPVELATECIRRQVPEGASVSAKRADEVLTACKSSLDAWSRYSVTGSSRLIFDPLDRHMLASFHQHQQAERQHWMKVLSTEYATVHSDYD